MHQRILLAVASLLVTGAAAQSPVVGLDIRYRRGFRAQTTNFVTSYMATGQQPRDLFAIDFDAMATTLYGIEFATGDVFTIDPQTGGASATGVTATITDVSGLTAAADGVTWYASVLNGAGGTSELYRGDVTTGVFTLVGTIEAGVIIDVAIDSRGNLFGFSISSDSLVAIDRATGAGTTLGPAGVPTNFAQGMDFDWTDDTLWAGLYSGGGVGRFCALDVTDGSILTQEITTPLDVELELAIQVPSTGTVLGTNYCTAVPNSTGTAGSMSAWGFPLVASNDVTLTASDLPPNQFGIFVTSRTEGFQPGTGGSSNGNLCLSGNLGRFVGPGQVVSSGAGGSFSLALDLTSIPQGSGTVAVLAGETWSFQAWHRDVVGLGSNLTDGLRIEFR